MNGKIVFLEIFYFFCSDRTIEQQLVKKLKNRRRPFPFDVKMYVRVKRVARVTMFSIERSLSCKDTNNTRSIKV